MNEILDARGFVQSTLIEEFGDIVNGQEKHDYLSFLLISCGIEFLGRCMDTVETSWNLHKRNGHYFKKGITLFPACYQRRKGKNIPNRLYKGLRCGICHTLLPKEGIYVSSTEKQDLSGNPICLNIHTFYDDFRSACISLLNNDAYKDKLAEKFIAISNNSSTGSTQTIINLK